MWPLVQLCYDVTHELYNSMNSMKMHNVVFMVFYAELVLQPQINRENTMGVCMLVVCL